MLYAFFGADGRLDRAAMAAQVEAAVAAGAQGVAVLGLGTEVAKLSAAERADVVAWAAADLAGRLPLAVTVAEPDAPRAIAAARAAADAGAALAVLQPPAGARPSEGELADFFAAVAAASPLPVGVQNAPDYLGAGLSVPAIVALAARAPNLALVKAEGSALYAGELAAALGPRVAVFNGRCGIEFADCLRAGCAGMIPGIESIDLQTRTFALWEQGREDEAEAAYRAFLPMVLFMIQSLDAFLCYGKRIAAWRLRLPEVVDRAPALVPTPLGLRLARRYADALPPLPR
jgi:4-hydroxy-tetrahydrodipicolinate synthase